MAAEGCYLTESAVSNWPAGISEAEKQAIIDKVEQIIDQVTDTYWCETAFVIELNGNGKNRLFLPLRSDILTVTKVEIYCIELEDSWYTYDKNSIYLDPCAEGDGELSPELYYKLAEVAEKGIFVRGYNNIRVTGTQGETTSSDDIPEAIKQAAVILAEWENDPSSEAAAGLMKSEKIGDYSYTMLAGSEEDVLTGVDKADMLLRLYVKRKPVLMAP